MTLSTIPLFIGSEIRPRSVPLIELRQAQTAFLRGNLTDEQSHLIDACVSFVALHPVVDIEPMEREHT